MELRRREPTPLARIISESCTIWLTALAAGADVDRCTDERGSAGPRRQSSDTIICRRLEKIVADHESGIAGVAQADGEPLFEFYRRSG
jgi:hypothetical protein